MFLEADISAEELASTLLENLHEAMSRIDHTLYGSIYRNAVFAASQNADEAFDAGNYSEVVKYVEEANKIFEANASDSC